MEVFVIILYLLPSGAVAIFYLMKKEQAAAARVCGILGGIPLAFSFFPLLFILATMAIGGGVLALRKPKLAGVLMLAGAVGSVAAFLAAIAAVLRRGGDIPAAFLGATCLLSISFLIPGGILALTSRKGQRASKKMIVGAIAAFFAIPVLGPALYLLGLYIGLLK